LHFCSFFFCFRRAGAGVTGVAGHGIDAIVRATSNPVKTCPETVSPRAERLGLGRSGFVDHSDRRDHLAHRSLRVGQRVVI